MKILQVKSSVFSANGESSRLADEFVALAVKAGVTRFVALSGRGLDKVDSAFPGMVAGERAVRDSGAEWTIIRANNFNQNFDEDLWRQPLVEGRLALPMDATPEPFIDTEDVAEVAAVLLTEDGHHGQVYELSGARALSFAEAVAVIAAATGRAIEFVELTPQQYRTELLSAGLSDAEATSLNAMFAGMREGHLSSPTDAVRRLLGRDPIDFGSYAVRAAAAGAWAG
jgi:uncharacterized protein YbjT (DUF2867 family)